MDTMDSMDTATAEAETDSKASSPSETAGSKHPLTAKTKDGAQQSEKKLRRLEKNRLSARECRRRKREATEHMERQINVLEGENLRLRLQLQIGDEAEETNLKEEDRLTESLNSLLKSGASEGEVFAKIEEYKEKFADYGRDRRSAIEFHLRNVERLLKPSRTTSVVLATLQGGPNQGGSGTDSSPASSTQEAAPSVVESASIVSPASLASVAAAPVDTPFNLDSDSERLDSKTLFRHLVKILNVSPEQAANLKDSRFVAAEMDECLKSSLSVLSELRTRLTQCGEDLEAEFNNVRSILTPTQAAKFLVWVANNSACMHMLNELWSKVYPQSGGDDSGDNSP